MKVLEQKLCHNMGEKIKEKFNEYLLNTYKRIGPVFVKGKGSYLWDINNNKYLDFFPGWGVSILGHCHPRIVKAITKQAKKLIHLPNNLYSIPQAELAEKIVKTSFPSKVFFANSGAEAVEGAIKFSRLYGNGKRFEVLTMKNSFHGRTFGAMSATGQAKYKERFKPILPKFIEVNFNDLEDLKKKYTPKTVAVILELIQGEGGVNVIDKEFAKGVREFCNEKDLLLIVDEVQTGMGRTSKLYCYQNYNIKPDIMVLSKGLGAGFPISAFVVRKDITNLIEPGLHASTFGGNPLACFCALEVFKVIEEEKILENVSFLGKYIKERLENLAKKTNIIKEIRGLGLMIGIELKCPSYPIFLECLNKGLIINSTHENVLRIMPALNVKKEEIDKGLLILEEVITNYKC